MHFYKKAMHFPDRAPYAPCMSTPLNIYFIKNLCRGTEPLTPAISEIQQQKHTTVRL